MDPSAPAVFQALEQSGFGAAIRQSVWVYPLANIGHVVSVVVFAGAVAVMDVRLLGGLKGTAPGAVLRAARKVIVAAFVAIIVTGSLLFSAEASHLVLNPVFLLKAGLITLGLINVGTFELAFGRTVSTLPAGVPLPLAVRASAFVSLSLWLAVVACGRSIAYF